MDCTPILHYPGLLSLPSSVSAFKMSDNNNWQTGYGQEQWTYQVSWLGLRVGRHLVWSLHSFDEILQQLCHDETTINSGMRIIITITCYDELCLTITGRSSARYDSYVHLSFCV